MEEKRLTPDEVKEAIQTGYASLARRATTDAHSPERNRPTYDLGYDESELHTIPEGAVASSFGCGNPVAFAEVQPGQVVVDIGSGTGLDCLLAAERVGPTGFVIGVDMTPEMIDKAREHAEQAGVENVEFRLGDAEALPIADDSADWVISNCVINLAPDKLGVFREVARVLKPGGQVSISDIVLGSDLPDEIVNDIDALIGCVAGAVREDDYLAAIRQAGLADAEVTDRLVYGDASLRWFLGEYARDHARAAESLYDRHHEQVSGHIWSARIKARRSRS